MLMLPGRIHTFRVAGSKLIFIDLSQNGHRVQGVCNFEKIKNQDVDLEEIRRFTRSLRRGDIFSEIQRFLGL